MEKMKLNLQLFASSTIDGSSTASNCDCRIVWSSSKNDSNNTSTVTATVQIKKTGSSSTSGTFSGTITIDGTSYSVSKYGSWAWGDWRTVGSASKTVTHNENGTKAINISANLKQTGTSMAGTYSASGTATLDTINRASKLGAIEDFKLTDTITINITKYITAATDKLQIKLGDTLVKEINNITNGYSLTFTTAEQTTIKNLMTSPQATLIFLLTTINGETTLGTSTQSAAITSLDKPVYRNIVKKSNGHYQVAINGVVNALINDEFQVYDDNGNLSLIYYKPGDKYIIKNSSYINVGGCMTAAKKQIRFGITVPKLLTKIGSITVNKATLTIRNAAGNYILDASNVTSNLTAHLEGDNAIFLRYAVSTAMDGTNNTPVAVEINELQLTFN